MSSVLKRVRETHEVRAWLKESRPRLSEYANQRTAARWAYRVWKEKQQALRRRARRRAERSVKVLAEIDRAHARRP